MTAEERIKYLWDSALLLDAENHCKKLIKSHLIKVCRELAGRKDTIPLERFAPSQMCENCSMHWQENDFQMKLKPKTLEIKNSKSRRLIEKLRAQNDDREHRLLSKKQKKRAKWLLKRSESKVEIKCGFCQHKTMVALQKPIKKKVEQEHVEKDIETAQLVTKSKGKKKKKNKNITAGLKIPKVRKDESRENPDTIKNYIKSEKTVNLARKVEVVKLKPTKLKSKNLIKKEVPKVQSKTQKQNSLLQLAALLKSQGNASGSSSSSNNRLETFLKILTNFSRTFFI